MSANTVLLRAVLDHVEEIEHLCGELPPLSPRSRQSVASIHNRPFSLQSSLGETSPTTTMTANIITMIYVSMAAPPPVPRSDATACQRAPASTSSPRQQAPASLFDNDDGEDDKEKSVTGRNASTATAAVAARSSRVLAHTGSDPCPLADIVQAALGTHQHAKAKAADLEDLALARLLCGPPSAASLHDWVSGSSMSVYAHARTPLVHVCARLVYAGCMRIAHMHISRVLLVYVGRSWMPCLYSCR